MVNTKMQENRVLYKIIDFVDHQIGFKYLLGPLKIIIPLHHFYSYVKGEDSDEIQISSHM